ncbi:MAG TPA: cobalamin-dependent protein [Ilumatobacteraceae bacterium]|nr:cobalamin-dependent protein [Ilumatobacteraceae bacterium]
MPTAGDDLIDLQTAAERIGVHYQTAYRWVRNGKLTADLVGGRYLVASDDLEAVDVVRRTPTPPPAPRPKRIATSASRMHNALVVGDEGAVRSIVRTLLSEGTSVPGVVQQVIVPPLVRIGQAWRDGDLTVWVEHRASAIVERILGEIAPNPRGRRRGTVVVASVSGDHHSLPTSMAAVTLRADNWHVEHLGADMPPDELLRFCAEYDVDVVVLSSTNPGTARLAAETAERLEAAGTPCVRGAPGRALDELIALVRAAATR